MSDETDGGIRPPNERSSDAELEEVVRKFREEKAREVAERASREDAIRNLFERASRLEGENAALKAEVERLTGENRGLQAVWLNRHETVWIEDETGYPSRTLAIFDGERTDDGRPVVKLRKGRRAADAGEIEGLRVRVERAEAEVERLRSEAPSRPGHGDAVVMVTTTELSRLNKLEGAAKRVLAQKADDVCWRDVYAEMAGLVGVELEPELLERSSFLRNCSHFYDCLAKGEQYHVPPTDDLLRRAAASLCEVIREGGNSFLRIEMARAWLNLEMVLRTGKEL